MLQVKVKGSLGIVQYKMCALLQFSVRIMRGNGDDSKQTGIIHGRARKKHFGRKTIFQFTIWRELVSAAKNFNKSVSTVIVDHKLNQLTIICHCKEISQTQQYSESTLKKCGYPTECCLDCVFLWASHQEKCGQSGDGQEIW